VIVEAIGRHEADGGGDFDLLVTRPGEDFDEGRHGGHWHRIGAQGGPGALLTAESSSRTIAKSLDTGADLVSIPDKPTQAIYLGLIASYAANRAADGEGVVHGGFEAINQTGTDAHDDLLLYARGGAYRAGERPGDRDYFLADFADQIVALEFVIEDDPEDGVGAQRLANGARVEGVDRAYISFGDADDVARGGRLNDVFDGDRGADALAGDGGNDVLRGGLGNDLVYWEGASGFDIADGGDDPDGGDAGHLMISLADEGGDAFGEGGLAYTLLSDVEVATNVVARYAATLTVEQGGAYAFTLEGDEGAELWVNGARLLSVGAGQQRAGVAALGAGEHDIEVRHLQRSSPEGLRLLWDGPETGGEPQVLGGEAVRAADTLLRPGAVTDDAPIFGFAGAYYQLLAAPQAPVDFEVVDPGVGASTGQTVVSEIDFPVAEDAPVFVNGRGGILRQTGFE